MLTKEQVLALSKVDILQLDFRDLAELQGEYSEVNAHIVGMFVDTIAPYVKAIDEAFEAKCEDMSVLVTKYDQEPAIVKCIVWSQLTSRGIEQIERAKFIHRHFAKSMLRVFGESA